MTTNADLSQLQEELDLLQRFSKETAPLKSVSLEARLQLHARFRSEFLAISGRGEHLKVEMPPALGKKHAFETVIVHLWQSFVQLRELFLTEMLLLPPPMEKVCLGLVLAAECQAASCRIIGRLLYARLPDVERHLSRLCHRADALATELREADAAATKLLDAYGEFSKESLLRNRPGGLAASKRGVEPIDMDPLFAIRRAAANSQTALKASFPDKGAFSAPRHDALVSYTGVEVTDEDRDPAVFEFDVDVKPGVEGLGFGTASMPPDPVYLTRVEAKSWAEEHGIEVDDELVCVNGELVSGMTAAQLGKALKKRPVRLTFARLEEEPEDAKIGASQHHLVTRHDPVQGGFPTKPAVAKTMSEIGHHEWVDCCAVWWSEVVEATRQMIAERKPETTAFTQFLESDGQAGAIVGLVASTMKLGVAGRETDIAGARAFCSLREERVRKNRTDQRILEAMQKGGSKTLRLQSDETGEALLEAGDVYRDKLNSYRTAWPSYPGEQLNTIATSFRNEVQGSFLAH